MLTYENFRLAIAEMLEKSGHPFVRRCAGYLRCMMVNFPSIYHAYQAFVSSRDPFRLWMVYGSGCDIVAEWVVGICPPGIDLLLLECVAEFEIV